MVKLETRGSRTISHGLMELRLGEVKDLGHGTGCETSVGQGDPLGQEDYES